MDLMFVLHLTFYHFLADFVCQNNWMAQGKSKSILPLFAHASIYTAIALTSIAAVYGVSYQAAYTWILVNGLAHFAQDFVTSRINAALWERKQVHWFFVGIGADQFLHYATLFWTATLWLL